MKFDMARAWNDALALMAANREVLLTLAGIFFLLPGLVVAIVGPSIPQVPIANMEDLERMSEMVQAMYAQWWWLYLLAALVQVLGYLAILALLGDESRPTVGDAIRGGLRALLPAIGTYLLFVIGLTLIVLLLGALTAITAGIVAIITVPLMLIAMVYLSVKVSLSAPVIAVEKVSNPFTVIGRSWKLTKGNSLRLFAFFLLLTIAYMVISAVVGIVLAAIGALLGPEAGRIVLAIISSIVGAIATAVLVAALAAAHRQLAGPSDAEIGKTFE